MEDRSGQRGLFFCSLPLDAIINGREQRDGEPIRSRLACQPKTNCLLALTAGFYLHNSNPKAKAICTLPTPTSGAVFTRRHMEGKRRPKKRGERSRTEPTMNETLRQDESIAVTITLWSEQTLSGCNCCHSLDCETHLHLTVQSGFLNGQRALFLMIMQILFNGYRCHLHLVYCPDSLWHNFDSTGGSTTPKRSSLSADSRTDNRGYSS